MDVDIIIGVLLTILSQAALNIGQILEKKAVDRMPKIEETSGGQNLKNFAKSPLWLTGFILATISWYIYLPALAFAPISLLAPLMGVGLVILVIFSYFYLKEPIAIKEIIGIVIIIIGMIILGINSSSSSSTYTLNQVNVIFTGGNNIWFTAAIMLVIFFCILFPIAQKYRGAGVFFGLAAGLMMGLGGVYSKAFVAGFTSPNLLFTLAQFLWYIYIVMLIFGNIGGTVIQQMGFQHGKAIVVAPLVTIFNLLIGTLGGIVVFGDWNGLPSSTIDWNIISVVMIVVGVAILSFLRTGTTAPQNTAKESPKEPVDKIPEQTTEEKSAESDETPEISSESEE